MSKYNLNGIFKGIDFNVYAQRVVEWNSLGRGGVHDFSDKAKEFQWSLILEEYQGKGEFLESLEAGNKVGVLDGLIDLFVVASYQNYLLGEFDYKTDGGDDLLRNPKTKFYSENYIENLENMILEKNCFYITLDVVKLLSNFEGNVCNAIEEVLDSNDSKFPTDLQLSKYFELTEENLYNECRRIELADKEGRYSGVTYTLQGDRYVFKSDKGKIVKPITFKEPQLAQFV